MPDLEAGVDGREKASAIAALRGLRRRWHMVFVEAQRGFLGRLAGDGAVERAAERVEVRPGPLQAAVRSVLLLRRIAGFDDAGEGTAPLGNRTPRRSEIEQHRRAVGAHDDVVGGDVAVQEILRVHHLQRIEQRRRDAIELVLRGRPSEALEPSLEVLPLLEAHHHVGGGVGLEHAADAHDARMLEARQRARFQQEVGAAPIERRFMPVRFGPHAHGGVAVAEVEGVVLLDGDEGGEIDVLGLVGNAEATRADHARNAVAAVEHGVCRQNQATVQGTLSGPGS